MALGIAVHIDWHFEVVEKEKCFEANAIFVGAGMKWRNRTTTKQTNKTSQEKMQEIFQK